MLYILYNKSRAIWWLVPVRQPVGWYARDANLRVAPVKWHAICNTCYIYYTSNRVPYDDLYLSGNQSDDIYVRVAYLRVASVKWHATNTHTHKYVYYTTNRMPSVVYTCPIVPARQPSDYMFETIIIQSYLSSTRPMHETRVPYKIPPGALNKTYSQFIPAQSKDLSLTHYTL